MQSIKFHITDLASKFATSEYYSLYLKLVEDNSEFLRQIAIAQKEISAQSENYEDEISRASQDLSSVEKEISALIQALSSAQNTPAQKYITDKINSLDREKNQLLQTKEELENLPKNQDLSAVEFDKVKNLALSFAGTFDTLDTEQKRKALKTLVDKIVWDGENVHIYLFGASDNKLPSGVARILEPKREDSK